MIKDLILKNRSYRRFASNAEISREILEEFVDLARNSASGGNIQPLKYFISNDMETNNKIFSCLLWARYLKDWGGPKEDERPSAYIIVLGDKSIASSFGHDIGIACQSMLLGAVEKGYGGCMIGSINRDMLKKNINFSENYEIPLIIALGKPKEKIVLEELGKDGNIEKIEDAIPLGKALCKGGLPVAEITFRTAIAPEVIKVLTEKVPELIVGAGTVLTVEQVKKLLMSVQNIL